MSNRAIVASELAAIHSKARLRGLDARRQYVIGEREYGALERAGEALKRFTTSLRGAGIGRFAVPRSSACGGRSFDGLPGGR